ncbi:MAG: hypothetical protein ACPKPY_05470 [Nitrososphaeraceae archaeon]
MNRQKEISTLLFMTIVPSLVGLSLAKSNQYIFEKIFSESEEIIYTKIVDCNKYKDNSFQPLLNELSYNKLCQ